MFTIQQALEEYFSTSIGSYGGSQAGTGIGGVDGAGVITRYTDGRVFSENGDIIETRPDGTQYMRVIEDGIRIERIRSADGTVTLIRGDSSTTHYQTRWADGRVTERTYTANAEYVTEYFPGGLKITQARYYESGIYRREEYNANGELFHSVYDRPREYKKEYRLNEDGSWSRETSFYNSEGAIDGTYYEYNKKNDADVVLAGDYLTYRYEMRQDVGGPKEITETTAYYTGAMQIMDIGPSYVGVTVSRSQQTEFPDGSKVPGETSWWNARYEWRDHQNVYVPRPPTPSEYGYLDATQDLLEAVGDAVLESLPDGPGSTKNGVITLEKDTVSLSIEANVGTDGNDRIQGMGFLYGAGGNDTLHGSNSSGDLLAGGNDYDYVSYIDAAGGITASLLDASRNTGAAKGDIYSAIEGILGSSYNDRLEGDVSANTLLGNAGNDIIRGLNGDDVLSGGIGADVLDGGIGYDQITYAEANSGVVVNLTDSLQNTGEASGDTYKSIEGVIGSNYNDVLIGNGSDNVLDGGGGKDVLDGGDGNNLLKAGAGDDRLYSGAGADVLDGGSGLDTVSYYNRLTGVQVYLWDVSKNTGAAQGDVYVDIEVIDGTRFDDVLEGDSTANTFWGDGGDDHMKGGAGADSLSGGDGSDTLEGGTGADRLDGGNGRDTASYYGAVVGVGVYLHNTALNTGDAAGDTYAGIEVIDGSTHSDKLEGNAAANTFWGGAGHDALKGFGGADSLSGGDGEDQLSGGEGADLLDGGAGYDFAVYADATSGVLVDLLNRGRNTGEAAGDVYVAIEGLIGSAHADQFYGTAGSDDFHGGSGDDRLEGRGGADQLVGGEGRDHAVYWGASSGVIANLTAGVGTAGDAAGDRFYGIEGLEGSHHADTLTGDGQANTLYGLGGNDLLLGEGGIYTYGNDYIEGGDGADTISGGGGSDWLLGNAGRDVFRFDARLSTAGLDTLADFSAAEDRIALETSVFGFARVTYDAWGSPVNGTLSASVFKLGTAASTSTQRIIYDQASGALYFDADGVGGAAQVQFAKVNPYTALTAAHFQLFTL